MISGVSQSSKASTRKKRKKKRNNTKITDAHIMAGGKQIGRLKFFDESTSYGFLQLENDGSELFVHYEDLKKTSLPKELLLKAKTDYILIFQFDVMEYHSKDKMSKKAINIQIFSITPISKNNTAPIDLGPMIGQSFP